MNFHIGLFFAVCAIIINIIWYVSYLQGIRQMQHNLTELRKDNSSIRLGLKRLDLDAEIIDRLSRRLDKLEKNIKDEETMSLLFAGRLDKLEQAQQKKKTKTETSEEIL